MSNFNINLNKEFNQLAKLFESLPAAIDAQTRKQILTESAEPLVEAAKQHAPRSDKTHYMYSGADKLTKGMRAPKGMGKKVARFDPGNLSESIGVLNHGPFRKSPNVYVGPRYPGKGGKVGRAKVAPYAHMVEFGTSKMKAKPYMRPAFEMTKNLVFLIIQSKLKERVDNWEMKIKMMK